MISTLSVLSLLLGTSLACAAQRMPGYSVRLEQSGGGLFILGLALAGAVLPRFC